jgi:UDP-glucose 4-epimerase
MYKKILITGGAGYIGSHLARELKSIYGKNILVVVVDNLINSYKPKINDIVFEKVDITDLPKLSKIFKKYNFDYVYHMAALADARESQSMPFEYYKTNVGGTITVLSCIKENKIKDFFFASSCSVYGNADGQITEDGLPQPVSMYGQTKLISENIVKSFSQEYKINSTIFRLFNVAGADDSKKLGERAKKSTRIITNACIAALGGTKFVIYGKTYSTKDGTCGRDYIHVNDVAEVCALLLNKRKVHKNYSETFNVGSGNLTTNLDIVKEIEKYSGNKINTIFNDPSGADPVSVVSDIYKISSYYNWSPTRSSLGIIIKTSWDWFSRENI